MDNKYTEKIRIRQSECDYKQFLSFADIFARFQDVSIRHSELLHNDSSVLTPKNLFWVIAKSKIRIYDRPLSGDTVEICTWPEKPQKIRGRRNYKMTKDGSLLIEGNNDWVILDRNTNGFFLIDDLYDPDFKFFPERIMSEEPHRFSDDFSCEPFAEYTVRSIDIDFEGHMNNVAYVRALFGLFSREELDKMDPKEIEFHYKVSCYEGDRLLWYKRVKDGWLELCAKKEDQTSIFYARMR